EGFVGSTATALTTVAARPPFDSVHVPAELLLRKTPSVEVPAKSVDDDCESMTTSTTEAVGRPLLPAPQLAAPSVLTKIPAAVTAYTVSDVSGSIAIARTISDVNPELANVQVAPASSLLNTPRDDDPA